MLVLDITKNKMKQTTKIGKKIELFSRKPRKGWSAWGNQL